MIIRYFFVSLCLEIQHNKEITMSCTFVYKKGKNGKNAVSAKINNPLSENEVANSMTFEKLVRNPMLKNETAVEAYMNVYSKEFQKSFGNWENTKEGLDKINREGLDDNQAIAAAQIANQMEKPVMLFKVEKNDIINEKPKYKIPENVEENNLYTTDRALAQAHKPLTDNDIVLLDDKEGVVESKFVNLTKEDKPVKVSSRKTVLDDNGEPKLFYKTADGKVFTSYQQALRNQKHGFISLGFISSFNVEVVEEQDAFDSSPADFVAFEGQYRLNDDSAFKSIVDVSADSNYTSVEGITNDLIKRDLIEELTVYEQGEFMLEGKGATPSSQQYSVHTAAEIVEEQIGHSPENVEVIGNRFLKIEDARPNTKVMRDQDGNKIRMTSEELLEDVYKNGKKNPKYDKVDAIDENVIAAEMERHNFYSMEDIETSTKSEAELKSAINKILAKLGISVTSMQEYAEKYKTKYGTDPTVHALADIANKVIAFAEGRESTENMTEEVAHFIIEAYKDQALIDKLAAEVHNTAEWEQERAFYYEKYKEQAKNENELNRMVRREILGKVLQNRILNRNKNQEVEVEEKEKGFLDQLLGLFDSFMARIKSFLSPQVKSEFDKTMEELAEQTLSGIIAENLDANNIGKEGQKTFFNTKNFVDVALAYLGGMYYSTDGAIKNTMATRINILRSMNEQEALSFILKQWDKDLNRLLVKTESIRTGKEKIDRADILMLVNFIQNIKPYLASVNVAVKKEGLMGDSADKYSKMIEQMETKINNLDGMKSYIYKSNLKVLIDEIQNNPNYTQEFKDKAIKQLENELDKVGWWRNMFGIMINSNNIFLQLMGKIVHDMTTRLNTKTVEKVKPLIRFYEQNNFDSQEVARLMMSRDKDGKVDGYIISNGKHAEYDEAYNKNLYEIYKKHLGAELGDEFTEESFLENKKDWGRLISVALKDKPDVKLDISEEIEDFRLEHEEMPMSKEFYLNQRKANRTLRLSDETNELIKSIRYRRWEILNKYRDKETGRINMLDVSDSDMTELDSLNQIRLEAKNKINTIDGTEKTGTELKIAEELEKLDAYNALAFAENLQAAIDEFNTKYGTSVQESDITQSNKVLQQAFIDMLADVEQTQGSEEAFKTFMANGGFSFNDAFWSKFGDESLRDVLERVKTQPNALQAVDTIDTLISKMDEKKELLKMFTNRFNPSEVNGASMTNEQRERIRNLEDDIAHLMDVVSAQVKEVRDAREARKNGSNDVFENTVNDAYYKALKESGKAEEVFLRENMSKKNLNAFIKFTADLQNDNPSPIVIEYMMKAMNIDPNLFNNMTRDEVKNYFKFLLGKTKSTVKTNIMLEYGRTKVAGYYKRLAPKGFNELMENMRNGTTSVASVVEQLRNVNPNVRTDTVLDFLKVNADFSWMEDASGMSLTNKNYSTQFNGLRQFKKTSEFYNKDFYRQMGIRDEDIDEFEKDMLGFDASKASRKELALWQKFIAAKKESLDMYGMKHNSLFLLPQFSKGHISKWVNIAQNPVEGVRNMLNDLTQSRIDTQEYGAKDLSGADIGELTGVRVIPKYGVSPLEEKSDISEELIYSYSALLSHAVGYEVKNEHLEQANAIGIAIEHKAKEQGLKDEQSGRKAWSNNIDQFFYGISETRKTQVNILGRKIDVGKMIRGFNRFVSDVNLAFNPFVAATSYTTAALNLHLWKSDYFDKDSYNWSQREFWKLLPGFVSDTGRRVSISRLAQLAEITGVEDLNERLRNASFNKFFRLLDKAPQGLNEMANVPIKYSIMLAVLDDVRFYKGNFIQSKVFQSLPENQGKSKDEIKTAWAELRKDSLYNTIITKEDGSFELRDDMKPYKEAFDKAMLYVAGMTRKANSETDGVLSKADAINIKRDYAFSAVLMHKTFFSLNIDKRFKKRHLNLTTGREEVGSYRRMWEMAEKVYKEMPSKSPAAFISGMRELYNKLSPEEKEGFMQTVKEWGVAIGLMVAAALMAGVADDDDNKDNWAIQAAAYIIFRTASEYSQSHPLTGWTQAKEMIEEPFVSAGYLKDLFNPDDFSFKEIKSGKYEGVPRIARKALKAWYPRAYFNLQDLHNTVDGYAKRNKVALFNSPEWFKDE